MPQMAPMLWLILFLLFTIIFLMFAIFQYFAFNVGNTSASLNSTTNLPFTAPNWMW